MADVALGEIRLIGLDGPKEACSDARPYSYASQFGACFVRLLMVAGLKEESSSGSRDLFPQGGPRSQRWIKQSSIWPIHNFGERHKEIKRQKSGHERKARLVLELEER